MSHEKKFPVFAVTIIPLIFVSVFACRIFAQNASWVSVQLPGSCPNNYQHKIGETCYIFVDDTSNVVYGFSTVSGQWHTYEAQTGNDWNGALADGNVAMVWNDSIAVVFNALTGNFSPLASGGKIIMDGTIHGCLENFAYVVGKTILYVFDASEDIWHAFSYTVPGVFGATVQGSISGDSDYIYLHLTVLNDNSSTLAAYSLRTHTYVETTEENIAIVEILDHGFTFNRYTGTPYLCGGYSAYSGYFDIKTCPEAIFTIPSNTWPSHVSPNILSMFTRNEFINTVDYEHFIWVYNTLTGNFHEYSYIINVGYEHRGTYCGGQLAIDLLEDIPGPNRLECILFYPDYGTWTSFFTYLYHWGYTSISTGGEVFSGYDDSTYYVYDIDVNQYHKHSIHWTPGYYPNPNVNPIGNYWSVFGYQPEWEDTLHVFSYTRTTGALHAFDVRSNGNAGGSGNGGLDLFWMYVGDPTTHNKMFIYAPLFYRWIEKDMTSASYYGGKGNYCYINFTDLGQTYFYDGKTNVDYLFPSAQVQQYVVPNDSVFSMYSNTGKYIGYSIIQHDTSEYVMARLGSQKSGKYIILNTESGGPPSNHLIYDGYNNVFAQLTLTATHGTPRTSLAGGKTAVVLSSNGYLFAYAPGVTSAVEEKVETGFNRSVKFELSQNYPNPFNPITHIQYGLPEASHVKIEIYNVIGQKIATLINKPVLAGHHEVAFNGQNLPSGVYYYQIVAGAFSQVRKMILMK